MRFECLIEMGSHKRKSSCITDHFSCDSPSYRKNKCSKQEKNKKCEQKRKEARYGNYHQYYGYRNIGTMDSRIQCMKQEWFVDKDVLDIGCNAGHFTLALARDLKPRSIIGIDIDNELVKMAMKNVRHYITSENISETSFPLSLVINYGPVAQVLDPKGRYSIGEFPFNVQFLQANYILPSDAYLNYEESLFDTILCLSLTKWIHLNWGDAGIKRLFNRIFKQLNPGGYLILEAQTYQSYARRKKINEEVLKHYKEIKLFPEMFNEFLLKEVGFQSCELIDVPAHASKGFSRPLYLFKKADDVEHISEKKPKHIVYDSASEDSCDDSDVETFSD
ncbi:7SK snRNA methylphosphate capping enzyme [Parasteatoda tepidariorum]|nr:7SK snRNA methylphosphate capping enzyme [Parasteatoda tepidariorum]